MSTKRLQRVKVSATGVERGGGRVKQCVNLVRLRGALMDILNKLTPYGLFKLTPIDNL